MEKGSSTPPRILVVEPSATALHVLTRRIADAGYRVTACPNPSDVLAELHRHQTDLVLAELRTKPMSGIDVTKLIRAETSLRETPVILITGKSDATGAVEGFAAGADDVVAKPFHFEVLLARIARRLARARSIDRLRRDNEKLDERVVTRAIEIGELKEQLRESEERRLRLEALRPRD